MRILFLLLLLISCGKSSSGSSTSSSLPLLIEFQLPGLGRMTIRNGVTQELSTLGVRKYGDPSPLLPTDKFHLGSCTKAMTATLAAILIEEGKLNWTSPLKELLPEFNLHASFQNMTYETLLVHRAGLSRVKDDSLFRMIQSPSYTSTSARELITRSVLEIAPVTTPGSRYDYNNTSYIIAAYILEKLTGESWETLMREKLFNPLDMKSCGFGPTSPENTWAHKGLTPIHIDNPEGYGPAARVHCSLPDWGKFLQQHVDGFNGSDGIVHASTFLKLHTRAGSDPYTYGGWLRYERSWANGPALTHDGSNTVNYAKVWLAPKLKLIMATTTNTGGAEAQKATESVISDMINGMLASTLL
ncbi:serine hydrolase domain-containing protein [Peredibacter starrii]|uniref:Serine hydrolase domain-containing protein n=1 Tax=Peredibacter starrii TaxID=28202 RepID=A0AAX4HUE0_9BACT|nr:serine hydrolase domain-containing protein [Peredibacter starrii]WPU66836.1 serine hydrolase domain-containing protein [Peredibacter starrii]